MGDSMVHRATEALPHRIHMVGIGGIGLSAIARVLAGRGHQVTGSDQMGSAQTDELAALGVRVYIGHRPEQIQDAELVIVSSAVPDENEEIVKAQQLGVPVMRRREVLACMMEGTYGIAVAGTHGKTTTSAMVTTILAGAGLDPTFIVGGVISNLNTNARTGSGAHFVLEADEYDHTFEDLAPQLAVVTNIEMDHPDCYADVGCVGEAFAAFLSKVPEEGTIVACADSPVLAEVLATRPWRACVVTYGLSPETDYHLAATTPNDRGGVDYRIMTEGATWAQGVLQVPGVHNALNATAALIAAFVAGVDPSVAADALEGFCGALRRFEFKGECKGIVVIDDYAHHPTEVRATLAAARQRYPGHRLWAVWQPHTYSRAGVLLHEFATCFEDADRVIVTDIYKARSHELETVHSADLVRTIENDNARYIGALDQTVEYLLGALREGDLLITLGAGDGYLVGERVLSRLKG